MVLDIIVTIRLLEVVLRILWLYHLQTNISSQNINQYLVEGGGKEYKVNDRLVFDNTGTDGDGVSGTVSTVEGEIVSGLNNAVSAYDDIYTTTISTLSNHYLNVGDLVTVSVADNSNTRTINTKIYYNKYFKYLTYRV